MVYRRKTVVVLLTLMLALMVGACNGDSSESPFAPSSGGALNLQDLVSSAAVDGNQGVLTQGFVPSAGAGPSVMVSGNQTVVNDGTSAIEVSANSFFTSVFVVLGGDESGPHDKLGHGPRCLLLR